ncbi:helix-turn-helix domain-containing protein [Jiangella mangrovi]|uniref:Transcriptional regulator with XRE-family HTH domain n=1 Tax=Jiangella mangrovi TaxID=1524084 RepID=A0A7W9GQ87_9ACTN|nr:helix-turn-helix transcriptional regulator [Jiangella mangrovi]MBB5788025.1 transcriptional regulator with XRE-family HTH domain [Jiangella mangrovi]
MTATYSSVQQARQVLADRLRDMRVDARLTGQEHARRCGWHAAKTSRIERGKTAPAADDIRTWCRICGADDQAADLVASLRAAEGMFIEWRRMERDGLRHAQEAIRPLYERTRRFRAYSSWVMPGIIQTPGYTEQVLRAVQRWRALPDDVEQALESRVERQRLLARADKVFAFVLEETVLRATVVDAEAMAAQLGHLLEVASLPNISLGVVPAATGREHWPVEDFWLYDDAQVNVELVSGYLTVTQPREILMYAKTFARLAEAAVYGRDARALIRAAADGLSGPGKEP